MNKKALRLFIPLITLLGVAAGNVYAFYSVVDKANPQGAYIKLAENSGFDVNYYMPDANGTFSLSKTANTNDEGFSISGSAPSTSNIGNYKFIEWCTDVNLTTAVNLSGEITSDMTLYAKYVGYFLSKEEGSSPSDYKQLVIQPNGSFLYEGAHNGNNAQIYKKFLKSGSSYLTDCSLDGSNETHVYDTLVTDSGRYKVTLSADGKTWDIKRVVGLKFTSLNYWKAENTEKYVVYSYTNGQGEQWSDIVTSGKETGTVWFYITPWYNSLIFVRLGSATANWDNKWNQSGDISLTAKGYSSTSYVETCTAWDDFANNFGS